MPLRMGEVQGQGYIGQALGWADVLAVAYKHALNLRPRPEWSGRDRFLLSHGHYAIAFYAALIEAGIVPTRSWRPTAATTAACPCPAWPPTRRAWRSPAARWARACHRRGHGAGLRHNGNPAFVYNSMSDGELDEGSTWEAAMGATTSWAT
jgi:transketolase